MADDDLQAISEHWFQWRDAWEEMELTLEGFRKQHPLFAREIGASNKGKDCQPYLHSTELQSMTGPPPAAINSEIQFAVMYGYKQAMFDLLATLDENTSVPVDESGEPIPFQLDEET